MEQNRNIDELWTAVEADPLAIRNFTDTECRVFVGYVRDVNRHYEAAWEVIKLLPECPEHGVGCTSFLKELDYSKLVNDGTE